MFRIIEFEIIVIDARCRSAPQPRGRDRLRPDCSRVGAVGRPSDPDVPSAVCQEAACWRERGQPGIHVTTVHLLKLQKDA